MRTAPVDLAALRAAAEFVPGLAGVRRQEMFDILLRYGAKMTIAIHAPLEGRDAALKREPA